MKFGGTSMAGTERIRRVARIVKRQQDAGHEVAVVVSAMAGETDRLVNFCREANPLYDPAEYDVVVASGEQVTSGLLAIALQALGANARSWLGWQLPIKTVEAHAKARIDSIDAEALIAEMQRGVIAVIPGFQGMSEDGRVTTLGRGGSDTSAVAVAAAVKADRCDIYTDVDGVYTTDPRIVARAQKLDYVTYEEMLELASVGAKVLQTRSVGLAMKEGVRVQVLSSFIDDDAPAADTIPGTMIVSDEELEGMDMERQLITGIAHDKNEAKITLTRVPDKPGAVANIFGPLAEAAINSVSCGCMVMRLTPNGLVASALVAAISASSSSGVIAPQAITPKPPAFEMAETRLRSDTQLIAPHRIAVSLPRKAVPRAIAAAVSGWFMLKPLPRPARTPCAARAPRVRYNPPRSARSP